MGSPGAAGAHSGRGGVCASADQAIMHMPAAKVTTIPATMPSFLMCLLGEFRWPDYSAFSQAAFDPIPKARQQLARAAMRDRGQVQDLALIPAITALASRITSAFVLG